MRISRIARRGMILVAGYVGHAPFEMRAQSTTMKRRIVDTRAVIAISLTQQEAAAEHENTNSTLSLIHSNPNRDDKRIR
jgi:hypothetical protein